MGEHGILSSPLDAIGRTPLVRLRRLVPASAAGVLVKLEGGNPTGSYKDRMARSIVEAAERRGDLRPGRRVVEYSGGSTGSSLAFVCAVKGYALSIVSSDAFAKEKLDTMRALGAEVTLVDSDGGRITPDLFVRMREEVERIVERDDAWWVDQFHNADALTGYAGLGAEILAAAEADGIRVDAFCAGVGTAGMLVGAAGALRRQPAPVRVVALGPTTSPMLTEGRAGPHRVEGIATGIVPPLLRPGDYDEAATVGEAEARALALRLARTEGIFAGTSAALNVAGALRLAEQIGEGGTVVTVATDTGLKYLAGDLYRA